MTTNPGNPSGSFDAKRVVAIAYLVFAGTGAYVLARAFQEVFTLLRINDPSVFGVEEIPLSGLLGVLVAGAAGVGCYINTRIRELSLDVASELRKVSWPSMEETKASTIAVLVATFVSAMILGVFDFASSKIMTQFLPDAMSYFSRF